MVKANWSCDECGEVLPADHFVKVSDREVARSGGTTRFYKGTRGGLGFGGAQERLDALRRARARTRIASLVGLAVAGVIILAIANQPSSPSTQSNLLAPAEDPTVDTGETAIPAVLPTPVQTASPTAIEDPEDVTNRVDSETMPSDASSRAVDEQSRDSQSPPITTVGDRETVDEAISAATPAALESGETTTWQVGSQHGYILVSAPRERGGKTCRNASWTMITPNNQIQGPSKEWCKGSGGGWKDR